MILSPHGSGTEFMRLGCTSYASGLALTSWIDKGAKFRPRFSVRLHSFFCGHEPANKRSVILGVGRLCFAWRVFRRRLFFWRASRHKCSAVERFLWRGPVCLTSLNVAWHIFRRRAPKLFLSVDLFYSTRSVVVLSCVR